MRLEKSFEMQWSRWLKIAPYWNQLEKKTYILSQTDGKGLLWELKQQVSEGEKWMNMKVNKCSYRFFPYRSYSLRSSLWNYNYSWKYKMTISMEVNWMKGFKIRPPSPPNHIPLHSFLFDHVKEWYQERNPTTATISRNECTLLCV
jgi:hypothetical protein